MTHEHFWSRLFSARYTCPFVVFVVIIIVGGSTDETDGSGGSVGVLVLVLLMLTIFAQLGYDLSIYLSIYSRWSSVVPHQPL